MIAISHSRNLALTALMLCFGSVAFGDDAKHIGSAEATRIAVAKPQPVYPPMAKQLRLQGNVEVEATIEEDGSVNEVRIVSGNAVLTAAAVQACKHWKFPPQPGKTLATISFTFKM